MSVVPGIKQLHTEVETLIFTEGELFTEADIPVVDSGTPHDVTPGIAEKAKGGRHKAIRIVELKAIVPEIAGKRVIPAIANPVRAMKNQRTGSGIRRDLINRRTCRKRYDCIQLPSGKESIGQDRPFAS